MDLTAGGSRLSFWVLKQLGEKLGVRYKTKITRRRKQEGSCGEVLGPLFLTLGTRKWHRDARANSVLCSFSSGHVFSWCFELAGLLRSLEAVL